LGRRRQNHTAVQTEQRGNNSSCDSCTNGGGNNSNSSHSPRGSSSFQQQQLHQQQHGNPKVFLGSLLNLSCLESRSCDGSGQSKYYRSPYQRFKNVRTYLVVAAFCGFVILANVRNPEMSRVVETTERLSPQKPPNQSHRQQPQPKPQELRGTGMSNSGKTASSTESQVSAKPKVEPAPQDKSKELPQQQKEVVASPPPQHATSLVDEGDFIYKRNLSLFDAAPIILPEYKLVFFSIPKVACTTFKFLFRRIMGIKDWDNQDYSLILPHNPLYNNLKYLWDYNVEEANEIMTSPEWTRAIFVREPKLRFLSAFLDKAIGNDGWHVLKTCCREAMECKGIEGNRKDVSELLETCHLDTWDSRKNAIVPQWNLEIPCCKETKECREKFETFEGFLETIGTCHDEHWGECEKITELFVEESCRSFHSLRLQSHKLSVWSQNIGSTSISSATWKI
jgi:Sulfotransferase family